MTDRNDYVIKLWQGGVPMTAFALILLLTIVSVIITGAGLHSAFVWLILMAVCILCFTFCNCVKCKKRSSLWRRSSISIDSISTISDGSSIINSIYPFGVSNSISMRRDLPPSYMVATSMEPPPPPYSALVHTLRVPTINHLPTADRPPPYTSVFISTAIEETSTQGIVHEISSINSDSISIISGSDVMRDNKSIPCIRMLPTVEMQIDSSENQTQLDHSEPPGIHEQEIDRTRL